MKLQRTKSKPRFSKRSILKFLGLPFSARWEKAEPILKDRIVSARRNHDDDRAKMFSGIKAFLKRNLKRSCQICGKAIVGGSQRCQMHRWLSVSLLLISAMMTSAGTLRTNIVITIIPPTNANQVISITNGAEIVTFTNTIEKYDIYSSPNTALNTTNWPVLVTVPGNATNVNLVITDPMRFYAVKASNSRGESDFSNVVWTPPAPDAGVLEAK